MCELSLRELSLCVAMMHTYLNRCSISTYSAWTLTKPSMKGSVVSGDVKRITPLMNHNHAKMGKQGGA